MQVYEMPPPDFKPQVEAAACYLEVDQKFLLLQLSERKSESGKWGVPAGKLEKDESAEAAAIRELFEETGIQVHSSQVQSLGTVYMRKPHIDYIYHLFQIHLNAIPSIFLSDEHEAYTWANLEELKSLPLMKGAFEGLKYYYIRKQ